MRIEHLFLWGLIWGLSLAVRFWGLNRLDPLVFDEVYYAKFAQDYLTGTPFFDAHPPLGKYLIALGIRLGGFNPIGYRWLNALVGSLVPLVTGALAYRLSGRPRLALL
ncbi:MAG: phospholipid carrier-dependent glycosyltransferase, partial [Gloeomargaritaceae cyanobacterium C42_A2020_066]|nr:phospholipid carrier-dependent glycosyltransferase [Gloeomargaritaceae cyanobacterium C42_A2020_066]